MALKALINLTAGSVPDDAEALLEDHLGRTLRDQMTCDGGGLRDALTKLQPGDGDTLIVWGGDGTIAAALSALQGSGTSVLPLPGGTMNLVHKRVHGGVFAWDEALDLALQTPDPFDLAYAVAADRPAYVAVMAGKLTHLSESREALREGDAVEAVQKAVGTSVLDLQTGIAVNVDGEQLEATAAAAFLPQTSDGDALDIGLIDPDSLAGLASTGLSALLSDWRTAEGVTFRRCDAVTFRSLTDGNIDALLDGERAELGAAITVTIKRGDVLVRGAAMR